MCLRCIRFDLRLARGLFVGLLYLPVAAAGGEPDPFQKLNVHQGFSRVVAVPMVQAHPNVVWVDGALTAGTDGRYRLQNTTSHAGDLRSQWQGSLVFENNERARAWEDIKQGDLRVQLSHPRGDQFFANFRGSTDLQVVGSGIRLKPYKGVEVQGFAQETIQGYRNGRSRTSYSRLQLTLRLAPGWSLQPSVYRYDIRAATYQGWTGINLFVHSRRASVRIVHEGRRSDRYELAYRKKWGRWVGRAGAQWARWMDAPRRRLLHGGLQRGTVGLDVYQGTHQLAVLARWGPITIGQSRTPYSMQHVLGVQHVSFWVTETPQGTRDVGFGLVFRGLLRRFAKQGTGWNSYSPIHSSTLATPHDRWPGFGSRL